MLPLSIFALMFKPFNRAPKPITREERLAKGWVRCDHCEGYGRYHNGWVVLGCHRCIDGLTTPERAKTAFEWETHCAFNRYDPDKVETKKQREKRHAEHEEIMARYTAARAQDYDYGYFRNP